MKLSFVIPCLNEEKTIQYVVEQALKGMRKLSYTNGRDAEILVVDNGSRDNSISISEKAGARVVSCKAKGNGNALRHGFENALGEYIIMLDADGSYDPEQIEEFIKYLEEGYDLVLGSRLKGNMERGSNPWLHRHVGTPIQTWMCNLFFGTKISDIHSGMRGFRKASIDKLKLESEGFELCTEMMIKAGLSKTKIKEIPINFYKDKRDRPPHLHTWTHGIAILKYLLLFAANKILTITGILGFLLGSALMFSQARGPVSVLGFTLDIHFMILGTMLSITSFVLISSGILLSLFSSMKYYYYKNSKILKLVEKYFSFGKGVLIGTLLFLLGLAIELMILVQWVELHFEGISAIRPTLIGFYFIFLGINFINTAFLYTILKDFKNKS